MSPAFVPIAAAPCQNVSRAPLRSATRPGSSSFTATVPLSRHAALISSTPPQAQLTPMMAAPAPGEKINVAVLGATGSVGQRFMQLLDNHPWFHVKALGASPRSAGKKYSDAVNWKQAVPIPKDMANIVVSECNPSDPAYDDVQIVFDGMDAQFADEVEVEFARNGKAVFSNARCHRMDADVPILIPTVNIDHLDMIPFQQKNRGFDKGFIITNANCSTTAMAIALKPLHHTFGIDTIMVSTMQAISGAGYPGLSSMDVHDNVVPYIGSEEGKMETESMKILGTVENGKFVDANFNVSAMCNRVLVLDGHTECMSVKLKSSASPEQVIQAINNHPRVTRDLGLPSAPEHDVVYTDLPDRPQPRLDRNKGNGFTVTVGRVRPCNVFDVRMVALGHNTIIGAAGGSLINAELCVVRDLIN